MWGNEPKDDVAIPPCTCISTNYPRLTQTLNKLDDFQFLTSTSLSIFHLQQKTATLMISKFIRHHILSNNSGRRFKCNSTEYVTTKLLISRTFSTRRLANEKFSNLLKILFFLSSEGLKSQFLDFYLDTLRGILCVSLNRRVSSVSLNDKCGSSSCSRHDPLKTTTRFFCYHNHLYLHFTGA